MAVLYLPLIRLLVLNTQADVWLTSVHFTNVAALIGMLRESPPFIAYVGGWAMPVFVASVFLFWITEQENADIPKQFLLLPITYVPFSIIGTVLQTAEFQVSYLYVQPLVILPFGYLYVSFWTIFIWLLGKINIVQ